MTRQAAVAALLVQMIKDQQEAQGITHDFPDIATLLDRLFRNSNTMRLKAAGFRLLSRYFAVYDLDLPLTGITAACLLYLERESSMPWYIGRRKDEYTPTLFLFDSQLAIELKLRDGDFAKLLANARLYGQHRPRPK